MPPSQRPTPTTRERLLRESIDELSPAKSLQTVDDGARSLLSSVTIAGTLVGGLGLVGASEFARVGAGWALPALICVGSSIVLAAWALIPVRATVAPGRLDLMDAWFADQIKRRGNLIRSAALLFALSIPLALLPLVVNTITGEDRALDVTVLRTADRVEVKLVGDDLPVDATVDVFVVGVDGAPELARGSLDVDPNGAVSLAFQLKSAEPVTARAKVIREDDGRPIVTREVKEGD